MSMQNSVYPYLHIGLRISDIVWTGSCLAMSKNKSSSSCAQLGCMDIIATQIQNRNTCKNFDQDVWKLF